MYHAMFSRLVAAALALALLGGCTGRFATSYSSAVPAGTSAGWSLADVRVDVPETLTVSEAKVIFPQADIVWREDEGTDRRAQVAAIIDASARRALAPLAGERPVVLDVTVERFHAMTFEAEHMLNDAGVHDILFTARVSDAATGATLFGPQRIEASLPAMAGTDMVQARQRGSSQKAQISAHLEKVFAGWLGLGPDPRMSFVRIGG
ncbi:MAG: hypothetical protein N2422_10750 [Rhodobacteraceae bacterium]|nr:hypothetical protein [Paracoccaceae bacterium]